MTETKEFPTLDVVTVATGTLVSDRGMASIYEVCNWMLDDNLMTHQLPNASRTLEPHILREHPWILMWDLPNGDIPALKAMCAQIVEEHGDTVTLTRPDEVEWVTGNAMPDLEQIAGTRRIIQVDLDEDGGASIYDVGSVKVDIVPDLTGLTQALKAMQASSAEAVEGMDLLAKAIRDSEQEECS